MKCLAASMGNTIMSKSTGFEIRIDDSNDREHVTANRKPPQEGSITERRRQNGRIKGQRGLPKFSNHLQIRMARLIR
jgi:hypothetical protein